MANKQGFAEAYKEVVHEYAMTVGESTKAPDYCLRVGGTRKFFLEAKKPSVNVKESPEPSLQLRRYGWSAKLPLCILTNFEEFAVFDTRIRPKKDDPPSTARIQYMTLQDLPRHWDVFYRTFSKEGVLRGSFDKYAESEKDKKGTIEVDDAFLAEIEGWRGGLARNIALRNAELNQRDLNFAVQSTIDRIVFLRICEDRGIESSGRLRALLEGQGVYDRLKEYYRLADERYNSGLFHFTQERGRPAEPDTLTPILGIDDRTLKVIIKGLYPPDSPYEFSFLPTEILGQVYEQFLGKVIRLTAGHQAKVEDKPEVKKAGGVYYTPSYVVNYVVGTVLGRILDGRTPKDAADVRVVDPACGSGSFLIGAYQFLLDWHLNWYVREGPEKHKKEVFRGGGDSWFLTAEERRRILLQSIFGVDIDPQAVEVTKLSLLLKVLEQTSGESIDKNQKLFHERALPDLDQNIKCGNSLIAPDYYSAQQTTLFDDEDRLRINVFDWKTEFPKVFGAGRQNPGFDAVIGNPPYVRQESLKELKEYFKAKYNSFDGVADLYVYFVEKAISLLRERGQFSYVVSSSFLHTAFAENLRRFLKANAAVLSIVDFGGLPVFKNAKDTYVCIPHLEKGPQPDRVAVSKVQSLDFLNLEAYVAGNTYTIPHQRLAPEVWSTYSDEETAVFEKVERAGQPLGDFLRRRMFYGIKTGLNDAFVLPEAEGASLVRNHPESEGLVKKCLGGEEIRRYHIREPRERMIVVPAGWTRAEMRKDGVIEVANERAAWKWFQEKHPGIANHLSRWEQACRSRQDQGDYWWELRPCDYYQVLDSPKLFFPDICKDPRFHVDSTGLYLKNTAYCLGTDDLYLLGILNSQLFWFAISHISIPFGIRAGRYRYRLIYQYMEKVPVKVPDANNPKEADLQNRLVAQVRRVIDGYEALRKARNPQERTSIQREIEALDDAIDGIVYQLYGLTDDEIRIVERENFKSESRRANQENA